MSLQVHEIDDLRLAADKAGLRGDHEEYTRLHTLLDAYKNRNGAALAGEVKDLRKKIEVLSEALRDIKVLATGEPTKGRLADIISTATDALKEAK